MEQYDALYQFEKNLKELELENQLKLMEYTICSTFPPKPPPEYQFLFDCRLKLCVYETISLTQGKTRYIATTARLSPEHGWCTLYLLPNPTVNLAVIEDFINTSQTTTRIFVRVCNLSVNTILISQGTCIGYLLLK